MERLHVLLAAMAITVLPLMRAAEHPPIRGKGSSLFGSRPHVHAGFLRSWHASGLHHRILERVQSIAEEGAGSTTRQMTVYVTGEQAA